ncbi:MAG: hypothetical protein C4325_06775 [Blastocatellia bacterium]
MTKNGKPFVFLLRHSSANRIYIRRVSISRGLVQNGLLAGTFLLLSTLLGGGIYGIVAAMHLPENAGRIELPARTAGQFGSEASNLHPAAPSLDSGGPYETAQYVPMTAEEEQLQESILRSLAADFLPNIWAKTGKINNEFGFRRNPFGGRSYEFHAGMDIGGDRGEPVIAPGAGRIIEAGWKGGYGNMIEIDHGKGVTTRYGHLSKIEVEIGDNVTRGQIIGRVGSTGRSTGPHLHYELRINDRPINPRVLLPPEPKFIETNEGN